MHHSAATSFSDIINSNYSVNTTGCASTWGGKWSFSPLRGEICTASSYKMMKKMIHFILSSVLEVSAYHLFPIFRTFLLVQLLVTGNFASWFNCYFIKNTRDKVRVLLSPLSYSKGMHSLIQSNFSSIAWE